MKEQTLMEKVESLAKRRGFIYQGSEIYGGLAGTWDYGPLGVALKNAVKNSWRNHFIAQRDNAYEVDAAILMHPKVWESSGHVAGFTDPMVECTKCKRRFREDQVPQPGICPECSSPLGEPRQFNMMFKTYVGAVEDSASISYLRPETAQGIFVNFKNVVDSFHPKLPFGIGQIGKAFRNEITPRDFIFRVREFEQMELEFFTHPSEWEKWFEFWQLEMKTWMESIGLAMDRVHIRAHEKEELSHYSSRTEDFEFDFPFGTKELFGLAYRGDFDLTNHGLSYQNDDGTKTTPHVIEPTFGVDRTVLALLLSSYSEDELGGETRVVLRFGKTIAPYRACVSPLLKNKPELVEKARQIYTKLKKEFGNIAWDDNGNIGKRYRRQDEIGTPACITIDFQTLEDGTVTIRDRDTGEQSRFPEQEIQSKL